LLRQQCSGPRPSTDTTASFAGTGSSVRPTSRYRYLSGGNYDVPGIEISRIDTLDFDDGSLLATCSGKHGYGAGGSKQSYILLNRCVSPLMGFTGVENARCRKFYFRRLFANFAI